MTKLVLITISLLILGQTEIATAGRGDPAIKQRHVVGVRAQLVTPKKSATNSNQTVKITKLVLK
jgi:hypothetical protein